MYHSGNQMIDSYLLLAKAQVQSGMCVADLGCGRTGHIVFPASLKVGERGIVYAVDVMKDVLENIHKRAAAQNQLAVQTVWSDLECPGRTAIPAHSLDAAFIINVLNQSDNRQAILEEARRLLKDKARLIVVDWSKKGLVFAPPDEDYVDFEAVKKWSQKHGFVLQEEFSMGNFHYGLVLFKHD